MNRLKAFVIRVLYLFTFPISGLLLHNSHRVRVIITVGDEVLLQRSSVGHQRWSIPGGGIEKNESDEDAVIREVQEEVGVRLHKKDLVKLGWQRIPYRKGWPIINLTFFQVELSKKPPLSISRPLEILDVGWFSIDALPEKYSNSVDIALNMQKKA